MSLKLTLCFKIVIKNLVGGRHAWAIAHGAIEQRMLLAQEENVLVPESGRVFSEPCLHTLDNTFQHLVATWYKLCHLQLCFAL